MDANPTRVLARRVDFLECLVRVATGTMPFATYFVLQENQTYLTNQYRLMILRRGMIYMPTPSRRGGQDVGGSRWFDKRYSCVSPLIERADAGLELDSIKHGSL